VLAGRVKTAPADSRQGTETPPDRRSRDGKRTRNPRNAAEIAPGSGMIGSNVPSLPVGCDHLTRAVATS